MGEAAEPLPRGRHSLSAEQVALSQCSRLKLAALEVASAQGRSSTSVSEVVQRARVSRETFYSHFRGIDDLINSAVSDALAHLEPQLRQLDVAAERPAVVETCTTLLGSLKQHAAAARCMLLASRFDPDGWDTIERRLRDALSRSGVDDCSAFLFACMVRELAARLVSGSTVLEPRELQLRMNAGLDGLIQRWPESA